MARGGAFCGNGLITSKYTWWNFLPMNLFQQFKKIANTYFLVICVLQCFESISISGGKPTNLMPLIIVVVVVASKDAYEDCKRHKADEQANAKPGEVFVDGKFVSRPWGEIGVSDVIRISKNQPIPADVVLLQACDESGFCYVETKSLDGETNLKLKQAPK